MLNELAHLPRHIFISYAKEDREFADRLASSLREDGLQAWIDDEGIEPGTPNWEITIRQAVRDSYAVALVCSPNTITSSYIGAELQLAESAKRQVVPIWMSGASWIDCVPLGLVNSQYVDCRNDSYHRGARKLIEQLCRVISKIQPKMAIAGTLEECPKGFVPILVPKSDEQYLSVEELGDLSDNYLFGTANLAPFDVLAVNANKYASFEEITDDLFTFRVRSRYRPYTYGRDWILAKASSYVTLLAVPWVWLKHKGRKPLVEIVPDYGKNTTPLSNYGIGMEVGQRSVWGIVNRGFEHASGLLTSDQDVAFQAFSDSTKGLLFTLMRVRGAGQSSARNHFRTGTARLSRVDPDRFVYNLAIVPHNLGSVVNETVFVIRDPVSPLM